MDCDYDLLLLQQRRLAFWAPTNPTTVLREKKRHISGITGIEMLLLGSRKLWKQNGCFPSYICWDAECLILQEVRVTETDGLALCFEESARYLWGHEVLLQFEGCTIRVIRNDIFMNIGGTRDLAGYSRNVVERMPKPPSLQVIVRYYIWYWTLNTIYVHCYIYIYIAIVTTIQDR